MVFGLGSDGKFFHAGAVFENSADTLAQLSYKRHAMLFDRLDGVAEHLCNVVWAALSSRSTAKVSRNLCGRTLAIPARRPKASMRFLLAFPC